MCICENVLAIAVWDVYTTSLLENNQAPLWADAIFSRVYKHGLSSGGRRGSVVALVKRGPTNGGRGPLDGGRRDSLLAL
jgi:hypothetical protein